MLGFIVPILSLLGIGAGALAARKGAAGCPTNYVKGVMLYDGPNIATAKLIEWNPCLNVTYYNGLGELMSPDKYWLIDPANFPPPGFVASGYDSNKLYVAGKVNESIGAYTSYPTLGNLGEVRTAPMYVNGITRRVWNSKSPVKDPLSNETILCGTFADMVNYILFDMVTYRGADLSIMRLVGKDHIADIIDSYLIANGQGKTLGREGPTCANLCSAWSAINIADVAKLIAGGTVIVAAFIAAPATGGASLLAALPAAKEFQNTLK